MVVEEVRNRERLDKREEISLIMRKKITKVLLSLMVALVCMLNCGITALAESDCVFTKEELLEKYSVDTGNTQADELFNNFLEKASAITTEGYAYYFDYYRILSDYYTSRFVTVCKGTEEEWKNKDTFEQYLWDLTYVAPLEALTIYSWDELMGDHGFFRESIIGYSYEEYSKKIDKDFGEAYLALMEWQYNYLEENNAIYNFMTGEDSLGNTKIDEMDMGEQQKAEESKEESKKETSVKEESVEESILDDTTDSAKPVWLILGILGVLVVAIIGVIIYRKSKGNNNKAA